MRFDELAAHSSNFFLRQNGKTRSLLLVESEGFILKLCATVFFFFLFGSLGNMSACRTYVIRRKKKRLPTRKKKIHDPKKQNKSELMLALRLMDIHYTEFGNKVNYPRSIGKDRRWRFFLLLVTALFMRGERKSNAFNFLPQHHHHRCGSDASGSGQLI